MVCFIDEQNEEREKQFKLRNFGDLKEIAMGFRVRILAFAESRSLGMRGRFICKKKVN